MLKDKILGTLSAQEEKLWVDDVFSTHLYTGNGATQTINNGIDLAEKGGLVWVKGRFAETHALYHTARGASNYISTDAPNGQSTLTTYGLQSFTSSGFTTKGTNDQNYVAWTYRNADKFYNHTVVTKSAGSNATVSFANLGTIGMVRVKRTDASGSWYVWHRSLSAGKLLIGETTAGETTLGHITVSGTTITLVNGVIADGSYLVEAWAHDDSADGIIQCGSYVGTGTTQEITLGWEPQFVLFKKSSTTSSWYLQDSMRGMPVNGKTSLLFPNDPAAESTTTNVLEPTATGFKVIGSTVANASSTTYIYLAIRRPNKPPTTGTQVYTAVTRTGTAAAATISTANFPVDLLLSRNRGANSWGMFDRLRGRTLPLYTTSTAAETADASSVTGFDLMNGFACGADANANSTVNGLTTSTYVHNFFRRAPGFFDAVCYTGTGVARTVPHNLGAVPELMIIKKRSSTGNWISYQTNLGNNQIIYLNSGIAAQAANTDWNTTNPTSSVFSLGGASGETNANAGTYVWYGFATLPGISKVGSYTGNGSSQTINCGFSTGARLILIKRTDSTGDWYIWDSVRGIVTGNDPHLSLNTTAAEVTTDDSVDPENAGFSINQVAATNINVNAANYIFLAIA